MTSEKVSQNFLMKASWTASGIYIPTGNLPTPSGPTWETAESRMLDGKTINRDEKFQTFI